MATGISILFYAALTAVLLVVILRDVSAVVPGSVGKHIGSNSESYLIALVLAAWVQGGYQSRSGTRHVIMAVLLGGLMGALGLYLYASHLPAPIKTLNESFIACAVLIPWCALPHRPWQRAPACIPLIVVVLGTALGVSADASFIVSQAESVIAIAAIILALDVWDRGLLVGRSLSTWPSRVLLWSTLTLIPLVVVAAGVERRSEAGFVNVILDYLGRGQEGFVAAILLSVFLAVFVHLYQPRVQTV